MKVKIGNGYFRAYQLPERIWNVDLAILLEDTDERVLGRWFCTNGQSDPDPLPTKVTAETNIMIFAPLDRGVSASDLDYKPSARQFRDMAAVAKAFLRRAKLANSNQINQAVQDAFGTYSFPIPWDDIKRRSGKEYSISMTSVVRYRRFELTQVAIGGAQMIISIPYRCDHFARQYQKCTEGGLRYLQSFKPDFTVIGAPVKAKTKAAKKLRKGVNKELRKLWEDQIKELKEKLRRLEEEKEVLKKD